MHTPSRPKSIAFGILLGTFLAGAAVGFATDRALGHDRPSRRMNDRAMRDEFAAQLALTTEQRHVVDSVFDWQRARIREVMQRSRPSVDSVRDSARVLMRRVLTPAQDSQFTALLQRTRRTTDSIAAARRGTR